MLMNKMVFLSGIVIELILGAYILDFYFGEGIVHSPLLCGISALLVLIFYFIRKKTSYPPKSDIKKFIQIGLLSVFGISIILLWVLMIYIVSQI